MHVVLLNQPFHPDVVATAQMAKDLADDLVAHGHTVTAVASRSIYGRAGAQLPKREVIDGIRVERVGVSLFGRAGILARLADFLLFYVLALVKVLTLPRADVIVCFTTPPFIAIVGLIARLVRGTRAVYWVMDVYPDVAVASGVLKERSLINRVLRRVHRWVLGRSDASVVLGRCMRERVLAAGAPAEKLHVIPVWAPEADVRAIPHAENPYRRTWNLEGRFAVMYSGNFGMAHDAATICGAMLQLRDEPGVEVLFVGGGKRRAEVEAFIAEHKLTMARWEDYQPRESLGQSLAAADAHLVTVLEGMEGLIVPSKLFGIMASGRPAVYIGSASSEIARVISETGCGVCVQQGDSAGLARAIKELKADPERCRRMGEAGQQAVREKYNRRVACASWRTLLESLV